MKKTVALLLVLVMALGLFVGCSGDTGSDNTLVYGSGDYDSINPIMNEHCEIKHLLFDSLVKRDGDGNLVASLAESWSYDEASPRSIRSFQSGLKLTLIAPPPAHRNMACR